jgi:hypothetical protein
MRRWLVGGALTALSLGCGESVAPLDTQPDAAPAPDAAPYFEGGRYVLAGSHANVVRRLGFISLDSPGVAKGFDLDGRTSPMGERESCGHGDLTDPQGRAGVDNQLANIWSSLAPLVGPQVQALLQNAINEGRVLIMLELAGVDDLKNDDDVTLRVYRGLLRPEVGTRGLITPDQTFDFDYASPVSMVEGARIVDGVLEAGPTILQIPIIILDLDIVAQLHYGRVHLDIADDGTFTGYMGGALNVPEVIGALLNTGASAETRLVKPLFENNADMVPVDGQCTFMSMGMEFEATTAFVVRDATQE